MIKGMAEANKKIAEEELNPFKEQLGETLPMDVARNYSGIQVRKNAIPFKINSEKLVIGIAHLKDQILIAIFSDLKLAPHDMESWLQTLNKT